MKTKYLIPNRFRKIGWLLFLPGLLLGLWYLLGQSAPAFFDAKVFAVAGQPFLGKTVRFSFIENNLLDELAGLLIILGALMIAFSKEKTEDEFITRIRMESLVWATYVNYFILLLAIVFIYDMIFLWVLVFNMFTILFFFMVRYHWVLYKTKKQLRDEE
jgi:hypothetical protein